MTETDDPPLRLLLGSDAVVLSEEATRVQAESDARWRSVSVSTDQDLTVAAAASGSEG
ncbi:MAG TPA: hypothetical protein VIA06_20890 [Candidatus Dormibacteraeota bacterium]|nr:hypothetical protein [Candidatus Dormibacteraeota bacterium]